MKALSLEVLPAQFLEETRAVELVDEPRLDETFRGSWVAYLAAVWAAAFSRNTRRWHDSN